jgi:hypothetical protein
VSDPIAIAEVTVNPFEHEDSASRRFREISEGLRRLGPEISAMVEKTDALIFGGVHNDIASNEDSWQGCLSHPNPRFRLLGLGLYAGKIPKSLEIIDRVSNMALNDAEELVRISAIFTLLSVFLATSDQKILKLISGLALEATESEDLRKAAYWVLSMVRDSRGDRTAGRVRKAVYNEYELSDFDIVYITDILKNGGGR